jgi:hypothetical protein
MLMTVSNMGTSKVKELRMQVYFIFVFYNIPCNCSSNDSHLIFYSVIRFGECYVDFYYKEFYYKEFHFILLLFVQFCRFMIWNVNEYSFQK